LLQPQAIYHSEASELTQPTGRPHPIEPFLEDPSPIERVCPAGNRALLQRMLAIRALDTARLYALHGRGEASRDLLRRFMVAGFLTRQTLNVTLLAHCAPVLPSTRAVYRWLKHRTRQDKGSDSVFSRRPALQ
jgi:hypothetical protein